MRERERLTPIVDVGLKAILMFIISPFDIPPYKDILNDKH